MQSFLFGDPTRFSFDMGVEVNNEKSDDGEFWGTKAS